MLDTSLALPDGRLLAYTDCGATNGPLVIYFHGAPMSRLDLVGLEESFSSLGVRVVSPDRPGYGGSTAHPGRGLNDWPDDVVALADQLGSARFAVMGYSSGGPYAVACAALLPERVASAGVVAGVTDMGWPDAWQHYREDDATIIGDEATIMHLGDEEAALRWCEEHYGRDGSRLLERDDDLELAPADMALMADEAMAAGLFTTVGEAFRQDVGGFAQDMTVQGRPWSFDPAVIAVPTRILHGERDTAVPIAHGRHTADLIPEATLVTFPEHGHLSIIAEIPQLCVDLVVPLS